MDSGRPVFESLDDDSVRKIHSASVAVLERTGVRVDDLETRVLMADAGADVDEKRGVVRLSEEIVADAIRTAPSEIEVCDRRGRRLALGQGQSHVGTCAYVPYILELNSSEPREATREDFRNIVRIVDSLPNIDMIAPPVHAWDIAEHLSALYESQMLVLNTSKHWFAAPERLAEAEMIVGLAETLCEEKTLAQAPFLSMVISTTSPLQFDWQSVGMVRLVAGKGIPLITLPVPMAGGTAPVTLAGTAVVQNSEFLFSLTLSQIINPGTPVVYGAVSSTMDMRTGSISRGDVEYALLANSVCQLARFYGVPSYGPHAMTESHQLDMYNGAQKMFCILVGLASGADISIGAGMLSSAKTASYEQFVLDDELYDTARRFLRGISVDEERLALSVIETVGPGGHYLSQEHTLRFLRSPERQYSDCFVPGMWERGDRRSLADRAHERVQHILESHVPSVSEQAIDRVRTYVREKEGELKGGR